LCHGKVVYAGLRSVSSDGAIVAYAVI
jgi:hypothetical protein